MRSDFLRDGYTEPGFIAAVAGLHGTLAFEYRPTLPEQQSDLISTADSLKAAAYDRKCADFIAKHLVSWDLKDDKGQAVPVSAVNVLRLRPKLYNRLYHIVLGLGATDINPEWPDETKSEAAEVAFQSALTETAPGAVKAEGNGKN